MSGSATPLPDGLLIAFYGDDFTGSSAVMEVLTFSGIPTVLFLESPTEDDLLRFEHCRAIGIAGVARAHSPEWMDRELPPIFASLERLRAPVTHYKTCSTLDSSPAVGSIGHAIDLGVPIFGARADWAGWMPLMVAAPPIGRYQAFGNLFAASDGRNYRLDRHPVMRRHPTTPMDESDVAAHLQRQTARAIGLVDVAAIKSGGGTMALDRALDEGCTLVSIDMLDDDTMAWAGEEIWARRKGGMFVAGSQGVEYALTAYWRRAGLLAKAIEAAPAPAMPQIAVASGSVSTVTAGQISWAAQNGFEVIPVDPVRALAKDSWRAEIQAAVDAARALLSQARSVLITTAIGPDDPAVNRLKAAIGIAGADRTEVNRRIGEGLGDALRRLLKETALRRISIAGGDTSGYASKRLGITALTAIAPLASGSALCLAHGRDATAATFEIALKGGQMGTVDFFGRVRAGRADAYGGEPD